jgi:hypothetical protein
LRRGPRYEHNLLAVLQFIVSTTFSSNQKEDRKFLKRTAWTREHPTVRYQQSAKRENQTVSWMIPLSYSCITGNAKKDSLFPLIPLSLCFCYRRFSLSFVFSFPSHLYPRLFTPPTPFFSLISCFFPFFAPFSFLPLLSYVLVEG